MLSIITIPFESINTPSFALLDKNKGPASFAITPKLLLTRLSGSSEFKKILKGLAVLFLNYRLEESKAVLYITSSPPIDTSFAIPTPPRTCKLPVVVDVL